MRLIIFIILVQLKSNAESDTKILSSKSFILTCCQAGAERALKQEILLNHPDLRLAFNRPGMVTFKSPLSLQPDFILRSVFARSYALSLGSAADIASVIETACTCRNELGIDKFRLHVWGRDEVGMAAEHPSAISAAFARVCEVKSAIVNQGNVWKLWLPPLLSSNTILSEEDAAVDKELVFNVIVPTGPHISEPLYTGIHEHSSHHSPYPGGIPNVVLPSEAPSRAYLKIEEALLWSGIILRPAETVVEIGSAPGGCSLALLRRGLRVVGIDPCPHDRQHDPIVLSDPNFRHIKDRFSNVNRSKLPAEVDWLLCDANLAPQIVFKSLNSFIKPLHPHIKGVIITLKLGVGNWENVVNELPAFLDEMKRMGLKDVRATQLPSHRQEIVAVGIF